MNAIPTDPLAEIADHGGSLARGTERFPGAPTPWLDLSTGINGRSYPVPAIPQSAFARLPEEQDLRALEAVAAQAYDVPSPTRVACAPGTQILLPIVASMLPKGRAGVLAPTYAEHRRAAALAGHDVEDVGELERLCDCDLAIVVNPNNPDGAVRRRSDLLQLAVSLRRRGGLLVVDEAFMDVGPKEESLAGEVGDHDNIVVLRSFGKFFGLAGIRLGFAICGTEQARSIRSRLGPWAISGPALAVGRKALADLGWQTGMRGELADRAGRMDRVLAHAGLQVAGGTWLYRFLRHQDAPGIVEYLGRRGILIRSFDHDPQALRFGIPVTDEDFARLAEALDHWRANA